MTVSQMWHMGSHFFFRMTDPPLTRWTVNKLEKSAFRFCLILKTAGYKSSFELDCELWGKSKWKQSKKLFANLSATHIFWENVHMQQWNNWGKTIWGFKGQMLTVKRCPHSNEAPGTMFWSERLKWVQWIAQPVTFCILKVTLFKKATLFQNEGISGMNVVYSSARPQVATQTRPGGVVSGCFFNLTFLKYTLLLTFTF